MASLGTGELEGDAAEVVDCTMGAVDAVAGVVVGMRGVVGMRDVVGMVCSVVEGTVDDGVDGSVDDVVDSAADVDTLLPSPPPQKQHA